MDNDADGRKLSEVCREAVKVTGRDDLRFSVHQPIGLKDWNDCLKSRKPSQPYLPIARASLDIS